MKRGMVLFLLAAVLLTVPVFADFGPKPQLTVRVENAPEELYYLDVLEEGEPCPYPDVAPGGLKGNYEEEELAALDRGLLTAFTAAVPEGWRACVVQGDLTWGKIDSEDGYFQFGYDVPGVCRILIVTKSGETFLSEPFDRQVLQCSATVDWAAKTVRTPPVFLGCVAQFLATFLPTLALEGMFLLLFGLWSKRNGLVFLLSNLATQGGLTLWMSGWIVRYGANGILIPSSNFFSLFTRIQIFMESFCYVYVTSRIFSWLLLAEAAIFLVEMGLYMRFFRDCSKKRAALYALTANLCSFALGLYLAEPVWRFVVKTIL